MPIQSVKNTVIGLLVVGWLGIGWANATPSETPPAPSETSDSHSSTGRSESKAKTTGGGDTERTKLISDFAKELGWPLASQLKDVLSGYEPSRIREIFDRCLETGIQDCLGTVAPTDETIAAVLKSDEDLLKLYFDAVAQETPDKEFTEADKAARRELQRRIKNYPGFDVIHEAFKGNRETLYRALKEAEQAAPIDLIQWTKSHQRLAQLITTIDGEQRKALKTKLSTVMSGDGRAARSLAHLTATLALAEHVREIGTTDNFDHPYFANNAGLFDAAVSVRAAEIERAVEHQNLQKQARNDGPEGQAARGKLKEKYGHEAAQQYYLRKIAGGDDVDSVVALKAVAQKTQDGNLVFSRSNRPFSTEEPSPRQANGSVNYVISNDDESIKAFAMMATAKGYDSDPLVAGRAERAVAYRAALKDAIKKQSGESGDLLTAAINACSSDSGLTKRMGVEDAALSRELTQVAHASYQGRLAEDGKFTWTKENLVGQVAAGVVAPGAATATGGALAPAEPAVKVPVAAGAVAPGAVTAAGAASALAESQRKTAIERLDIEMNVLLTEHRELEATVLAVQAEVRRLTNRLEHEKRVLNDKVNVAKKQKELVVGGPSYLELIISLEKDLDVERQKLDKIMKKQKTVAESFAEKYQKRYELSAGQ